MKVKNENFTPRERVNRELLDRMLAESAREDAGERTPLPHLSGVPYTSTSAMNCPCNDQRNNRRQNECRVKSPEPRAYRNVADNADNSVCRSPVYPGVSLAMVYSPCQTFHDLYEADIAIERGTIFKELDKPFMPTPCNERWCK